MNKVYIASKDKTFKEAPRNQISEDELASRMFKQQVLHDAPCSRAGAMVLMALDKVLRKLGVDTENDIGQQQEVLGIYTSSLGEDWPKQVRGIHITVSRNGELVPYAYVSDADIKSSGEIYCRVEWYLSNTMEEFFCGVQLVGG